MNYTVTSAVNSGTYLDAALRGPQEEVGFWKLVLSKDFVLNPVVFDIGQL